MLKLAVHSLQPNPVPLAFVPKELFWPSCALVWTGVLSHHIGPPLLLSAQVVASSRGPLKPASGVEAWPQHRKGCFQETMAPGDPCVPQAVCGLALISLAAASLVK